MGGTNKKWLTPLGVERLLPWLIGAITCGAGWCLAHKGWISLPLQDGASFFSAAITLGGVLTGFMATLKSLLAGMHDRTFERLRSSGYLFDLIRYVSEALWGSITMCVIALVGFWLPGWLWLNALLLGAIAFSLAGVVRVTRISGNLFMLR